MKDDLLVLKEIKGKEILAETFCFLATTSKCAEKRLKILNENILNIQSTDIFNMMLESM